MTDKEFLNWIADRLVNVYGESPNVDFVQRLREIANNRVDPIPNWDQLDMREELQ